MPDPKFGIKIGISKADRIRKLSVLPPEIVDEQQIVRLTTCLMRGVPQKVAEAYARWGGGDEFCIVRVAAMNDTKSYKPINYGVGRTDIYAPAVEHVVFPLIPMEYKVRDFQMRCLAKFGVGPRYFVRRVSVRRYEEVMAKGVFRWNEKDDGSDLVWFGEL